MARTFEERDALGSRMKEYERVETAKTLDPRLPLYARLDGRGFSKFTKSFQRPFDENFSNAMIETTRDLILKTNAVTGYTQSDEISLVWKPLTEENSSFLFDGKIQKLTSILASMATSKFMSLLTPDLQAKLPHFDCRIINLPNESEASNMVAWREIDARKNAISMLARCHFSHSELHKKSGPTMLKMLAEKGISFDDYSTSFRNGTMLTRKTIKRPYTEDEKQRIPEEFRPTVEATRTVVEAIDVAPYSKLTNKIEVMFEQALPERI